MKKLKNGKIRIEIACYKCGKPASYQIYGNKKGRINTLFTCKEHKARQQYITKKLIAKRFDELRIVYPFPEQQNYIRIREELIKSRKNRKERNYLYRETIKTLLDWTKEI